MQRGPTSTSPRVTGKQQGKSRGALGSANGRRPSHSQRRRSRRMTYSNTQGEGSGGSRIARSWRLSKLSFAIVRSAPAILLLAIISTAIAAVLLGVVYAATGAFSGHH